jgi:hypothetical protein
MSNLESPAYFKQGEAEKFFRKKYISSWFFGAGLLVFLLPFAQVKCSSTTLAENSGIGIALGRQWKVAMVGSSDELLNKINQASKEKGKDPLKNEPNIFAIIALAAGFTGLVFSFLLVRNRSLVSMSAGILAALMLIALLIQYKLVMQSALSEKGDKGNEDLNFGGIITIQFTIWYFISLISFATAAFIGYKKHSIELKEALKNTYDFEFERNRAMEE